MTSASSSGNLRGLWYLAFPVGGLPTRRMQGKRILGEHLLFGRDEQGAVFALRDVCPHRGIPLSHGQFDGREIECCYHGWRFNCSGVCTHIPSLLPTQKFDLDRVLVQRYPCREVQGNVWVYLAEDHQNPPAVLPEIPVLPGVTAADFQLFERCVFPCSIDHAVTGLMDPAHGPFVHRSWWWRSRNSIHAKSKQFAPSPLGFTMLRHAPSTNSRVYKLFGEVSTEIRFELPSTRIEHIIARDRCIVGLTTLTPLGEQDVELHQIFYWTIPWLKLVRPVFRRLMRQFIEQDRDVVDKQQQGLNADPQLMLINDADKPARWYYQIKREYLESRAAGRPFVNPVPSTTLQWRS